jgi:glutamate-ammonia-ligase adenylyltransferase
VVADGSFDADIGEAIAAIFARPRDIGKTIDDVVAMRALMAKERPPRHAFDLKLQPGGLVDLEFIAQSAQLVAGKAVGLPQAPVPKVLARLGALGLLPEADSLIETHRTYTTILQTMSAALDDPFKDEGWTTAFRELLAQLTNAPSFERLEADVAEMRTEVSAAAAAWYGRARLL